LGTLFLARESLVSDIPTRDGKSLNLYLQCMTNGGMMSISGLMTLTKLNYLDDDYVEHDQLRDDEHKCPDDLDKA